MHPSLDEVGIFLAMLELDRVAERAVSRLWNSATPAIIAVATASLTRTTEIGLDSGWTG